MKGQKETTGNLSWYQRAERHQSVGETPQIDIIDNT